MQMFISYNMIWPSAQFARLQGLPIAGYLKLAESMQSAGMDAIFTNWNHFPSQKDLHFGTGPVGRPNAHSGVQRLKEVGIVDLPDGVGLRMFVPKDSLHRISSSPVLAELAPASGLMEGILPR